MTLLTCAPTRSILKSFDDEGLGVGDEASLDGGGDERERERNKNVQQAAASPLSYHRNTSYTLCCPRIEQESAYFIYTWTERENN